jgi:hypothetical protein
MDNAFSCCCVARDAGRTYRKRGMGSVGCARRYASLIAGPNRVWAGDLLIARRGPVTTSGRELPILEAYRTFGKDTGLTARLGELTRSLCNTEEHAAVSMSGSTGRRHTLLAILPRIEHDLGISDDLCQRAVRLKQALHIVVL